MNLIVKGLKIIVTGEFKEEPGSIAENVKYMVTIDSNESREKIQELIKHTDTVADFRIHSERVFQLY